MPSMNTEEQMERYKKLAEVAKSCGGAFISNIKHNTYAQYTFDAEWNPKFQETKEYKTLNSNDILCLIDNSPWFFGGSVKNRTSTKVSGVVYTD